MWKFTQDRWVVRKEVAAVTKVSGFLFFLNPKVVISWPNAAGHCVGVDSGCCWKPFLSQCCFPLHLEGVDNTLSREKHSEQLPQVSTTPRLALQQSHWNASCRLSCFSGKLGTVWIELTEGAYTAHGSCSALGVLKATLLLAFASYNIEWKLESSSGTWTFC